MDSSTYYKDNDSSFEIVIVVTIFFSTTIFGLLLCCCCSPGFFDSLDHWINNHNTHTSNAEYGERVLRRMQDQEEKEKESPEVRRKKLLTSFANNKVSMIVSKSCFVQTRTKLDDSRLSSNETTSSSSTDDHDNNETKNETYNVTQNKITNIDERDKDDKINQKDFKNTNNSVLGNDIETGEIKELFIKCTSSSKNDRSTKVPNCCAICLCSYDIGDTMIWSCNKECKHAFHDECIIEWLLHNQNGECPCCRRQFTDLPYPGNHDTRNTTRNHLVSFSFRSWLKRIWNHRFQRRRE